MIENNVGVTPFASYEVKKIDSDFFTDSWGIKQNRLKAQIPIQLSNIEVYGGVEGIDNFKYLFGICVFKYTV